MRIIRIARSVARFRRRQHLLVKCPRLDERVVSVPGQSLVSKVVDQPDTLARRVDVALAQHARVVIAVYNENVPSGDVEHTPSGVDDVAQGRQRAALHEHGHAAPERSGVGSEGSLVGRS